LRRAASSARVCFTIPERIARRTARCRRCSAAIVLSIRLSTRPLEFYLAPRTRKSVEPKHAWLEHGCPAASLGNKMLRSKIEAALSWVARERVCWRLLQLSDAYPVNPSLDDDLGMLAIADIAPEHTDAVLPARPVAGTPHRR